LDEAFQRFEGRITEGHRESRKFSRRHPQGISGGLKAWGMLAISGARPPRFSIADRFEQASEVNGYLQDVVFEFSRL
jgi:hypothetical protein